jgi:hypothetical protein
MAVEPLDGEVAVVSRRAAGLVSSTVVRRCVQHEPED